MSSKTKGTSTLKIGHIKPSPKGGLVFKDPRKGLGGASDYWMYVISMSELKASTLHR